MISDLKFIRLGNNSVTTFCVSAVVKRYPGLLLPGYLENKSIQHLYPY